MSSNTLDELGRAVLESLDDRRATVEELEAAFGATASRAELEERLSQLVDNALITATSDGYELTENGGRVLDATPAGARDDGIDTPADVERRIEAFSLRPDEEDAVRATVSFLRYWGNATTAELLDGTYSEEPAGCDTAARWWDECVEARLAALPDVEFSPNEARVGVWRYDGEAAIEPPEDGRTVLESAGKAAFGSVRHGLEALKLTADERLTARVAFAILVDRVVFAGPSNRRAVTTDELAESVYEEYPAGYDSTEDWANWLSDVFDVLPGVHRRTTTEGDLEWTYSATTR